MRSAQRSLQLPCTRGFSPGCWCHLTLGRLCCPQIWHKEHWSAHLAYPRGRLPYSASPTAVRADLQPFVGVCQPGVSTQGPCLCLDRLLIINLYITAKGVGTQPNNVCRGLLASQGLNPGGGGTGGRGEACLAQPTPFQIHFPTCSFSAGQSWGEGGSSQGMGVKTGPEDLCPPLGEEPALTSQLGRPSGSQSSSSRTMFPAQTSPGSKRGKRWTADAKFTWSSTQKRAAHCPGG